jgi:hypothetical protein
MHYELWALNTGNLMSDYDSESEALATVRELIANGWDANDLGVRLEWDDGEEGDDDQLPPALFGAALAARANDDQGGAAQQSGVIRRSA